MFLIAIAINPALTGYTVLLIHVFNSNCHQPSTDWLHCAADPSRLCVSITEIRHDNLASLVYDNLVMLNH